ncbi:MAG TPA: efflux RND transporter permease subunit [Actinomycetota bacterium]|jgi:Cu/Ag efflux pump CusA|nr:efflux RND transporter permease subunit [Actinomycetota bacterium]
MMRWIVGSSIKFRRLVVAVAVGLLVYGVLQLDNARTDILPEFQRPTVEVQTEALGLSAEEVEELITVPLEQDLLVGIAFLEEIESVSLPGLSSVVMTFEPGTDVLDARQVVGERLTQAVAAAGLPQVARPPQMIQPVSSTSRVAMVKLSSDELSPIEMSILSKWVITPRLLGVEGVANVSTWGFRDRQLQVLVDPQRLSDADVTLNQIIRTAGNALEVSPLSFLEASSPGTGGFIDTLNERLHIFHEQAISTPEQLEQVPVEDPQGDVASGGSALTLGDVTDVVEDHQPLIGDALCSDGECLLLVIEKFPEANTPRVAEGIDGALDELSPGLPGLQMDTSIYRPAEFVNTSFDNLGRAALIGGILLLLVLGALFFEWRSAVVSAVAIVMSLAAAWLVLYFTDTTVNTMVLAGLAMALVVLIDDAVIDVDSVARRIHRHRADGDGTPAWQVMIEATLEMRSAILFATLVVAAVLLPAFFMEGEAGAFLPEIATAYLLAILASIVVAVTVTPALGMMLLGTREPRESPTARWLGKAYDGVATRIVPKAGPAIAVFGVVLLVGVVVLPFLDQSMRPVLQERDAVVRLDAPPGTSLQRMDEITAQAVDELRALPGIEDVGAHVGRAVQSDQIVNVNSAEVWVSIDGEADYSDAIASIESVAGGLPDVTNDVLTYSEQRITDVLGRDDDEIVVRVYGQDQQVLESKAEEVQAAMAGIDGIENARAELPADEPTIEVEPNIEKAESVGLAPGDVRRAATTLLSGLVVGNLFEEQKVFDVAVWGAPEIRESEADVENLLIDTPVDGLVPLGEIADVRIVPNEAAIRHESVESYVDVGAGVTGRDVGAVAADVERALEQIEFPLEHHATVLGGFEEDAAARSRVIAVAVAALLGIFLLLQAAFASWRLALLAFLTLPMALAGAAVAVLIGGGEVTLGSVAGFVAVVAVAVRIVVVLIRHYQQLQREGEAFGPELVMRGTRERLVPIVTTMLASAVALIPFIVSGGSAGFEIVGPMATALVGGLVTTTLLALVVIPAAYFRFGYIAEPDRSAEDLFVKLPDVDTVQG